LAQKTQLKIHRLLELKEAQEPSTLLALSKSFPVFNEEIEKSWEKPRTEDIKYLKDLDKYILKEFCCINKKSKSGLMLKESPNCSDDCQQ
jgi:hypothetical protein